MSGWPLLLALLPPALLGFLVVRKWPPKQPACALIVILSASLGLGGGMGASASTYYVWRLFIGPPAMRFVFIDLACWVGLGVILLGMRRKMSRPTRAAPVIVGEARRILRLLRLLLAVAFAVGLISFLISFAASYRLSPHGQWDAWVIWNCRARFLYRAGEDWAYTFSPVGWHSDYPLLLPAAVARCWTYSAGESTLAPAIIALLFALGTVGVLFSSLAAIRNISQGLIGGLILLGYRRWVEEAGSQLADIPFGYFMLSTAALFAFHDSSADSRLALPTLAGTFAGFAAWTKNEGLLFIGAVVLTRLIVAALHGLWRRWLQELGRFALGLLPPLAVLLSFKLYLAPPNDLIEGQGLTATMSRLLDYSRYELVFRAYEGYLLMLGPGALLLLVLYGIFIGRSRHQSSSPALTPAILVLLMLAGYFLIFVTTPREPLEHVANSLSRLLCQLWPMAILAFLLFVATPEELLIARPAPLEESTRT
jgi:hypothetical protein